MTRTEKRVIVTVGVVAALYAARRYYRNWGTTKGECQSRMPGDELVGDPVIQVTEGVWIQSPPPLSCQSLLQAARAGDGRDLQSTPLTVGDVLSVRPSRRIGLSLRVESVTPEQSVVLRAARLPNVVWSFQLQPHWATHTRLLARMRIGLRHPGEVVIVELARPLISLILRKALLDIKHRCERQLYPITDQCVAGTQSA